MTTALELIDRNFGALGDEFMAGGVRIGDVASRVGTPLFAYDRSVMERRLKALRTALPSTFDIYYSIKANPNQAILKLFLEHGCGLEIASGGEFYQAVVAGCEPARVLFAGPGKTRDELEYAIQQGVGEIHVESMSEIDILAAVARAAGKRADAAIRVNPSQEAQGGAMRMGGRASPFGVDEELVEAHVGRMMAEDSLRFRGVHLFVGTQILDHETFVRQYRKGLEIARRAARCSGQPLGTVDFGGGLGIPYYKGDRELDVDAYGKGVADLLQREATGSEFESASFLVEPGRYLVGESGVYVTRVTCVKRSRGKTYVVVDGGMNHHLAASGNLGQVIKRNFPIAVLNRLRQPPEEIVDVVGPLCTPLDVLARDVTIPPVRAGDLIGILQSGAYARSASPLGFLSHPGPPEVLLENGSETIVRRRGEYADSLLDQ